MRAAENASRSAETLQRIRELVAKEVSGERFVTKMLSRQLGLAITLTTPVCPNNRNSGYASAEQALPEFGRCCAGPRIRDLDC